MFKVLLVTYVFLLFSSFGRKSSKSSKSKSARRRKLDEFVVFANRGVGSFGIFEVNSEDELSINLIDEMAEPMYVNSNNPNCHSDIARVFIGDRTRNSVVSYNIDSLEKTTIENVCNGIFHQWINSIGQMWVVCDIDLTIVVIDTETHSVLSTVTIANVKGWKPHDITSNKDYTYVTLLSTAPENDGTGFIIQYSNVAPYNELNRLSLGDDPHVFINDNSKFLYVASQDASTLYKINKDNLNIIDSLSINGAHGIFSNSDLKYLYVTDITTIDGSNGLHVIDLKKFKSIKDSPFDSIVNNPHNVVTDSKNENLYVTNTANGTVAKYKLSSRSGKITNSGDIIHSETGSSPFGIGYVCSR